jgi:plastocyanin
VRTEPSDETEFRRRTTRRSRTIALVVTIVLVLAVGLTVVDVVGWSDRQQTEVVGGVAQASVTARDFGYVPAIVLAKRGVPVRVTIQNQGAHTHTFTIDSLGVDVEIPRGTTQTVTLHLPRTGRFEFYCRFHQAFGMRGHIIVQRG